MWCIMSIDEVYWTGLMRCSCDAQCRYVRCPVQHKYDVIYRVDMMWCIVFYVIRYIRVCIHGCDCASPLCQMKSQIAEDQICQKNVIFQGRLDYLLSILWSCNYETIISFNEGFPWCFLWSQSEKWLQMVCAEFITVLVLLTFSEK